VSGDTKSFVIEEILYEIFSLLDGRTLACVGMVCKRFQKLASTEELWKAAYYTLFPKNHDFLVKDYKLMYKNCTLSGKIPLNQVYEHLIKIIVIGERRVGKVMKFQGNLFCYRKIEFNFALCGKKCVFSMCLNKKDGVFSDNEDQTDRAVVCINKKLN
jgi:hypothetical protein